MLGRGLSAAVGCSQRLRGILTERHLELTAGIENRIEVCMLPVQMDGDEGLRQRAMRGGVTQVFPQQLRVDVPRRRLARA